MLVVVVLWATKANLPVLFFVVPFLVLSILEMAVVRALAPHRRAEDVSKERSEAVRRVTYHSKQTIVDDTTGLYTRWYFDRRIEEEAARSMRYKHSMAVIVLRVGAVDLTTFSLDGWQKRSLEAAQRAAKVVREVDISASLSPFEFAICLVHCDREGAYKALDRMLAQLPEYNCEAGVAVYPDEGHEAPALVDIAKARLRRLENKATA